MAILEEVEIVYLIRIVRRAHTPIEVRAETRVSAYCTAMAKAILAFAPPELVVPVLRNSKTSSISERAMGCEAWTVLRARAGVAQPEGEGVVSRQRIEQR